MAVGLCAYAAYSALVVPLGWDALSYHLPYARDYAEKGGLVISEYLRFPLHSHNVHLVYAVALIFSDEVATNLLHALSGVLVAIGMVAWCRENLQRGIGLASALVYVALTATYYDAAYVDLPMGLFVFFAFYALTIWQKNDKPVFLMLSAFLLAMAAGTKYQGLGQLAVFLFALLLITHSPRHFARVALVLILFGSWWYLRNLLVSGDPVHPMGGRIFGFWLWNEADLTGQLGNVSGFRDHLPLILAPALGSVFLMRSMDAQYRSLVVVGLAGLVLWYLSSRYDRYLLPSLPFLAILSVHVTWEFIRKRLPAPAFTQRSRTILAGTVSLLGIVVLCVDVSAKWQYVCFTRACVDSVYRLETISARVAAAVPGFDQLSLYQMGLENELYLLGRSVRGDWFGPYRYRDIIALAGDGEAVAEHLRQFGVDSLIVSKSRRQFGEFLEQSGLEPALTAVYEDADVVLYRLRE